MTASIFYVYQYLLEDGTPYYINGAISRMFEPGKELDGFYLGRKIKDNNNGMA